MTNSRALSMKILLSPTASSLERAVSLIDYNTYQVVFATNKTCGLVVGGQRHGLRFFCRNWSCSAPLLLGPVETSIFDLQTLFGQFGL